MGNYTVQKGDTLTRIAKRNNTSVDALCKANPKMDKDKIVSGQKITIPVAVQRKTETTGIDTFERKTQQPQAQTTRPQKESGKQQQYTIQKGDNLTSIAKKRFLTTASIQEANKGVNPKNLRVGQKINIPEKTNIVKEVDKKDGKFQSAVSKVLQSEGGFKAAEKDKSDVRTNKGITQDTYDKYLKDKAFDASKTTAEKKDVKNITDKEAKEIYYNYYYLKSGADKTKKDSTSYWMLDTAVNCGNAKAKELHQKCGDDSDKWYNERKSHYETVAKNNPAKNKFLQGWLNRINFVKKNAS